jgi:hypothetical protein
MASSFWKDLRPIWSVRSRQMSTQFAFWLALIGYNKRDRSLSHRVYLGYALVFFTMWGFAVLTLLAGITSNLIKTVSPAVPALGSVWGSFLILFAWGAYSLFQAGRRTPVRFSEEDAALICQTPVSRSAVTLLWLPARWIAEGLPIWAITVTLGFALAEIRLKGAASMLDLPGYVMDGLRPLAILIPLHLAVLALVWSAGVLRLRPAKSDLGVGAYGPLLIFGALLVGGLALWQGSALPWAAALANGLSSPLIYPIRAGFSLGLWLPGFGLAMVEAVLSLALLSIASREISLSRAAQESTPGQASALLDPDAAKLSKTRERLGAGRKTTRLPPLSGLGSLLWKQILQAARAWSLNDIFTWLGILFLGVSITLVTGWGPRAWAVVAWVIICGQLSTAALRDDLKNWYTLRQMPFSTVRLLWAEAVLPLVGVTLATWAGLAVSSSGASAALRLGLAFMVPAAASFVYAAAAYDIARQSKAALLLNGFCPGLSALGALIGLIGPAVCALGVYWAQQSELPAAVGAVGGLALCAYLAYLLGNATAGKIKKME